MTAPPWCATAPTMREVVAVLGRAEVAPARDAGEPVREQLPVLLVEGRHHPLAEVRAVGDPVDDLAVEEIEPEIRRRASARPRRPRAPCWPVDGDDRPPHLLVPLAAGRAASGAPARRPWPRSSVSCACSPVARRRHPRGRAPCQGYTCARRARPRAASLLAVLALAAPRLPGGGAGPLHRATFALPVSNDDAILLLMGRHVLRGELATTLWNQPYNGALDAYLLAPLLAVLPHHGAYRLYQLLCAALLVAARRSPGRRARRPGRRLGGGAPRGLGHAVHGADDRHGAAAQLPRCRSSRAFRSSPPWRVLPREAPARRRARAALGLGLVCGLAVWNSSLAIPAFAGHGARPRSRGPAAAARPRALAFASGLALGAARSLVARLIGASGAKVVTASSAVTALRPRWLWVQGLLDLGHALVGLVGLQVPLVVDGKERAVAARSALVVAARARASSSRSPLGCRSRRALPLLGWAAALAGAFWLSRRTGPDELRYLYGLNAPLLALAGAGLAALWALAPRGRRARAGLALLVPVGLGERRAGRDVAAIPLHAERVWEVPSARAGRRRAARDRRRAAPTRACSSPAASRSRRAASVIASQAWNERIPGDPLRFRDEVDLDPAPAWVLSPPLLARHAARRRVPRPPARDGRLVPRRRRSAGFVVFHGFRPPYDESRPVPAARDPPRDHDGRADRPRRSSTAIPRRAWTAAEGLGAGQRARGARDAAAAALGARARRRPRGLAPRRALGGLDRRRRSWPQGPARAGFQWVNGAPRAGKQALLVVPLGDREAGEVRLVFQGPGPRLAIAEVFLYGPDEAEQRASRGEASARDALRVGARRPLGRGGAPLRAGHAARARPRLAPRRLGPGPLARARSGGGSTSRASTTAAPSSWRRGEADDQLSR